MKLRKWPWSVVVRNLAGIGALMGIHYVSDRLSFAHRTGFNQTSPYLFLLLLYGWIVFHNRVLFERFYRKGKRTAYFGWTFLAMGIGTFNMYYILRFGFGIDYVLPQILGFWLYTITGLGVYVIYNYAHQSREEVLPPPASPPAGDGYFHCTIDGIKQRIAHADILYVISLENYVKLSTVAKTHILRLPLKEVEEQLPRPPFIRISRSHIINTSHLLSNQNGTITIRDQHFKIGKVYKRYVEEQLAAGNMTRRN